VDDREGWGKRDDDRKREHRYGGYGERKYKNDEAKERGDRRNRYESRNDYRRDGHYNRKHDRERHAGRYDRDGYDRDKYREYPYEPNIPAGHFHLLATAATGTLIVRLDTSRRRTSANGPYKC
jgi:hypothetical protein